MALARCDIPVIDGSLSRVVIAGVVIVGMVTKAFLCDRGRSHNVLPEIEVIPYTFLGHLTQSEGIKVAEV